MRAIVVYESMFGNTQEIAEAIGEGIAERMVVEVVRADQVSDGQLDADLLVAGGPTHAHTLSSSESRMSAISDAQKDDGDDLSVTPPPMLTGLRELFASQDHVPPRFAAFDTRSDLPRLLTGRASVRVAKELRKRGCREVVPPESFLVKKYTDLVPGECARAREWGNHLAAEMSGA